MDNQSHQEQHGVAVATDKPRLERPPMFRVVLMNDDFTPMDFVVDVLQRFFNKTQQQAVKVMMQVHTRGKGECGVFTREVAETRVSQVNAYARHHQHPLLCTMEKA